jgi:hypothetical protein
MCSEEKLEFNVNNWCKTVCREDFSISAKLYVENVHLYMSDTRETFFFADTRFTHAIFGNESQLVICDLIC